MVLTDDQLQCLMLTGDQKAWLNDEVINCYLHLLQLRAKGQQQKVHFFNSYFAAKLVLDKGTYNHEAVSCYTNPEALRREGQECSTVLACKTLYFPVNHGLHWVLIVVDLEERVVTLLDSMRKKGVALEDDADKTYYQLMQHVAKWVDDEGESTQWEHRFHSKPWSYVASDEHPRQDNTWDCGVYTLIFADYHSQNRAFNFGAVAMTRLRKMILNSLRNQALAASPTLQVHHLNVCFPCFNMVDSLGW